MSEDRVTLRDVYEAINRVEDKFDKRLDDMEKEVNGVKAFHNKAIGILSLLSLFAGSVSGFIWNKIMGKG